MNTKIFCNSVDYKINDKTLEKYFLKFEKCIQGLRYI